MSSRASARRLVTFLTSPLAGGVALAALVSSAAVVTSGTPDAPPLVRAAPRTSVQSLHVPQLPAAANARAAGERVLANLEAPTTAPYRMVGVTWPVTAAAEGLHIEARTRGARGWSDWHHLHFDPDHQDPKETGSDVRAGTEPLWLPEEARGVQVRVEGPGGARVRDVRVELIQPGEGAAIAPTSNTDLSGMPPIVTRAQWGADESLGDQCWDPVAPTVQAVFVHHTVGSNSYTRAQSASIVRGIHAYHTRSQGWCDIGYNFLIDRYGTIYEGRDGGVHLPVRGSHAGAVNSGSTGVSLMGNFQETAPPWAMQQALVEFAAWQLESRYRDPLGRTTLAGRTYNVVSGHRDAMSTACPGQKTYELLPRLRQRIADRMGDLRSANWQAWQRLGGESSHLGSPYVGEHPEAGGRITDFNRGSAYWTESTGAHVLIGGIRAHYWRQGGPSGPFGFPTTDERDARVSDGRFNTFQGGGIYWSKPTGANSVFGGINGKYHRVGGALAIGLPTTDEMAAAVPGGRLSIFQHARIYWSSATGPDLVAAPIIEPFVKNGADGRLGLPLRDAYRLADGRVRQHFQKATITWSPATGLATVSPR